MENILKGSSENTMPWTKEKGKKHKHDTQNY